MTLSTIYKYLQFHYHLLLYINLSSKKKNTKCWCRLGGYLFYVNILFLLIHELDLFIVQVNEIISVIPVNVNTTYAYVRYISACI